MAEPEWRDDVWASPLGVEGSLTNPNTPGGHHGREADPTELHAGVQGADGQAAAGGRQRAVGGGGGARLSTGQLSTWRGEQLAAGSAEALAQRKAEEAETQRLRREVKQVEEENLVLRKAAAVFSKRGG